MDTGRNLRHPGLIACQECDLVHRAPVLARGEAARCSRCGSVMYRRPRRDFEAPLAWLCAAAVCFAIANAFPIMSLDVQGQHTSTTLLGAVQTLAEQEMLPVAGLLLLTTFVAPAAALASMLYLLLGLSLRQLWPGFVYLLRLVQALSPWGMLEVFVLGIVVSVVKLASVASVDPGPGLWAFAALMVTAVAAAAAYDQHTVWSHIESIERERAESLDGDPA